MPLLGRYKLADSDVWVWKITETVDELSAMVPAASASLALEKFASRKRRAEWLAVRAIVVQQFGKGVDIVYDVAGKPMLDAACGYVSISHTKGYAVVAFSRVSEIGVDVELMSRNVADVADRYMPAELLEKVPLGERNSVALFHWCAKEALYKIVGDLGGNFKDNISVGLFEPGERGTVPVELVGLDFYGCRRFVADFLVLDDLLVVLCRR